MLGYLFERFPAYTQTFCYREVLEMERQRGAALPIFSIRSYEGTPGEFPEGLLERVTFLPDAPTVKEQANALNAAGKLPRRVRREMGREDRRDLSRVLEAIWLAPRLKAAGVTHVHVHFAGVAARTAYWLKKFYGITYSVTCHANDIFCENRFALSLEELFREALFLVAVADYTRAWLEQHYPVTVGKVHRIYNGIAPGKPMSSERFGQIGERPHIVSVGRCIIKKGFGDLIEACALLRERGVDFCCTIVGDGPLLPGLREKIDALGLGEIVAMPGAASQARVQEVLAGSTLFVLACAVEPDGGMDCLPTVIAEAMMWGLPVVSTRLAAVPEMVLDDRTGFVTEPHAPRELADAMEKLLRDPALAARHGAAGYAHALDQFSVERTVAQLRALIEAGSRKGLGAALAAWWKQR